MADCFSSDLQQVKLTLKVLYRIPDVFVIPSVRDYNGDPFEALIVPRVQEAVKEVTALKTAADIVKTRELNQGRRPEEGSGQDREDPRAIRPRHRERLAVERPGSRHRSQDGANSRRRRRLSSSSSRRRTDARTVIIKARADAESIRIQGEALQKNPKLVRLKLVEKWDGKAPQVLGTSAGMMLSLPGGPAK